MSNNPFDLNRRWFLAGALSSTGTVRSEARPIGAQASWQQPPRPTGPLQQPWVGRDFWANRLQDWRIRGGKLECLASGPNQELRTVHYLTREVLPLRGSMRMTVRTGLLEANSAKGFSGFLLGAGGGRLEYRGAALVHHLSGLGGGLLATLDCAGQLQFRDNEDEAGRNEYPVLSAVESSAGMPRTLWEDILLTLVVDPAGTDSYDLKLTASNFWTQQPLGSATLREVDARRLEGSIALVSCPLGPVAGPRFWFRDWQVAGDKIRDRPDRGYGPVAACLFAQSKGVLRLTAQFMPLDSQGVPAILESSATGKEDWKQVAQAGIILPGYTAHFLLSAWDSSRPYHYRIRFRDEIVQQGRIPAEPRHQDEIVVAGTTCMQVMARPADDSWGALGFSAPAGRWSPDNVWFPHQTFVENLASQKPDLLVALGDQFYESGSPTGRDHEGRFPELDFLYKWYLWCWSVGALAKDRPCVCLLDDHDIYHGNIWGEGGRRNTSGDDQDGGYLYDSEFVRMAERIQTWNWPDPWDQSPLPGGFSSRFTRLEYGGVSFALLEDRKFKAAPVRLRGFRPGVVKDGKIVDSSFDIRAGTPASLPLLGEAQMRFLEEWAHDWTDADFKIVLTQTAFASVQTDEKGSPIPDLDSNGWPMPARDAAIDIIRRGHAMIMGGDTHLPFVVRHGISTQGDGAVQFIVPPVTNKYRRWFEPGTGDHLDAFGNKVRVLALSNPTISPKDVLKAAPTTGDKRPGAGSAARAGFYSKSEVSYASVWDYHTILDRRYNPDGYGILRLNRNTQRITIECWPWNQPPRQAGARQFSGWPVNVTVSECDGRKAMAWLPELVFERVRNPIVQVVHQDTGAVEYTMRIRATSFRGAVFQPGKYRIRIKGTGLGWRVIENLEASAPGSGKVIRV